MYDDKFYPFYATYASPRIFQGEQTQEQEFRLMKSYYPQTARRIQEMVEDECQRLDYEGSRLYDEYPDKFMLYQMCRRIRREMEHEARAQEIPGGFLDELIQVLLCQEISRRRCRRHRCGRFF
jgi:hypothetical protein